MSTLALDYGKRRIGLALSRANFVALRYNTLEKNTDIIEQIVEIIKKEEVHEVVFGLPRGLDGKIGTLEQEAKKFASKIESNIDTPIIFIDEAFTSKQALENLKKEGKTNQRAKLLVDQEAARILLEEYIQSRK